MYRPVVWILIVKISVCNVQQIAITILFIYDLIMELLRTEDFYIFINGEHSLWWDRQTGVFIPRSGE